MPCFNCWPLNAIGWWLQDYERIYNLAVTLIYAQICFGLLGSLGAQYNGVLVIDVAVSLFALTAIESSSEHLVRMYAVFLGCTVFLDVVWFILFSHATWNISFKEHGYFFIYSVWLTLLMQIIGSSVRLVSSFLWIQMYRLGASTIEETDRVAEHPNSLLNPSHSSSSSQEEPLHEDLIRRRVSHLNPSHSIPSSQHPAPDDFLRRPTRWDPAYYNSLFLGSDDSRRDFEAFRQCFSAKISPRVTEDDGEAKRKTLSF